MRTLLLIIPLLGLCSSAPQLENLDPDILAGIFGDKTRTGAGGYGAGDDSGDDSSSNGISDGTLAAVVQIVKDKPADYVAPDSSYNNEIEKQVEVNTDFKNCSQYTESLGYQCVPYYQCDNGDIITDGAGLIDVRNGFGNLNPEDSKCPGFLDVCCKDPHFIPPPPPKIIYQPKCGRRNLAGVGARIQGFKDGESQFGEWPHMCAVLHDKVSSTGESTNLYKCGGSLIAPGLLLTAAHCVKEFTNNPTALKIRCGEWDTQKQSEPYAHQDRSGKIVKTHPEFNPKNLQNDFALVFLSEDFVMDFHIDTVCLPDPGNQYDGQVCYATGWGKDEFGSEGKYQVVLKEVDLTVVSPYECQNKLRKTRLGDLFELDDSFMCAGGTNGKDTCKGDGGSPLVCSRRNDPDFYDQVGIVAWGIGCGEDGTPGVYADVSKAVCWIDYEMSCQIGKTSSPTQSYFGYSKQQCGNWLEDKQKEMGSKASKAAEDAKKAAEQGTRYSGTPERVWQFLQQQYQQYSNECPAFWSYDDENSNIVAGKESYEEEFESFERDGAGYSESNTAEDVVKAAAADNYGGKSADGYVDPTKAADGYVDPAKSVDGYVDPAKSADGYEDLAVSANSYVDPAKSAEEYVDPAKSADSYVDPAKSADSYVDPTKSSGSY